MPLASWIAQGATGRALGLVLGLGVAVLAQVAVAFY
jgi:hypothetical protein